MNRKYNSLFLITFTLLLVSSAWPISSSNGGDLGTEIVPGLTIYYTMSEFTLPSEVMESDDHRITGDLTDSTLWIKIYDVYEADVDMYDSEYGTYSTSPETLIDMSMGFFTGHDITFEILNQTVVDAIPGGQAEFIVPEKAGFPLPLLFPTVTRFDVDLLDDAEDVIPIPLILDDDWDSHEAALNAMQGYIEEDDPTAVVDVVLSATELSFSVEFEDTDDQIAIDISASWRVVDGILSSISFSVQDLTDPSNQFAVAGTFDRTELNVPDVSVGDLYSYEISVASIDETHDLSGLPLTEAEIAEIEANITDVKAEFTGLVGNKIVDFEVLQVQGLYYQVEARLYDPTTGLRAVDEYDDPITETIWCVAFLGGAGKIMDSYNGVEEVVSGPVISPDWEIYGSWVTALNAIESTYMKLLKNGIEDEVSAEESVDLSIDDWKFAMSLTQANGYAYIRQEVKVSGSLDADIDGGYISADASLHMDEWIAWDETTGVLTSIVYHADGDFSIDAEPPATVTDPGFSGSVDVNSVELEIERIGFTVPTPVGDSPIEDEDLEVPGFTTMLTFLSLIGASMFIARRRR
ncbi:MAG: hypothetical protein ACTSYA_09155 [Candidatus Kariarchaeaceae archaeon]